MKRIKAAVWILSLVLALGIISQWTVYHVLHTTQAHLEQVRTLANAQNYSAAAEEIDAALTYFEARQHTLECFIRRDTVAAVSVSLHGLSAYTQEDNAADLNTELNKAQAQLHMMEHLFFSVF